MCFRDWRYRTFLTELSYFVVGAIKLSYFCYWRCRTIRLSYFLVDAISLSYFLFDAIRLSYVVFDAIRLSYFLCDAIRLSYVVFGKPVYRAWHLALLSDVLLLHWYTCIEIHELALFTCIDLFYFIINNKTMLL